VTDLATSILDAVYQAGTSHVFGIPGDAINGLVDAARRHREVEFVTMRHEEAGAFAASAQAKLTGKLGVVAGTAGPGAIHLLNGLYDAKLDRAPVLAITGQVETGKLGTDYQQEIDLARLFDDVALFSETLVNPEQAPRVIHNAIREAITRRGVAHLIVPADLPLVDVEPGEPMTVPDTADPPADDEAISRAAQLLEQSNAVTLLVGIGAGDAVSEVLDLALRLKAPIIKALRGKALIPDDHPHVIGGIGLLGTRPSVEAMSRTELLFMIGTDLPYADFYPDDAECIQLDIDPSRIGRRHPVDVPLIGDSRATLSVLLSRLGEHPPGPHLEKAQSAMGEWRDELAVAEGDGAVPIRPQRLAATIGRHTPPGTIFLCDTGAVTFWTARHLPTKDGDRFTLSSSLASMAFALPAAIGAQLAFPQHPVVAITGDGGFSMLIGDLMTAVALELPITIVVFNNSRLGLIQMEQEAEGLPMHAVDLDNPDFAAVAKAMGAGGVRVESPDELDAAIRTALSAEGPTVVDVVIDPDEVTMPPEIRPEFMFGYVTSKVRELFSGDGGRGLENAARQAVERVTR